MCKVEDEAKTTVLKVQSRDTIAFVNRSLSSSVIFETFQTMKVC